jgi:hypothetical protein
MAVFNSVCDERNIDDVGGKFALTNACGQHGSSYQNLRCAPNEAHMECPPDPGLQMTAVAPLTWTSGKDGPPPFFCGPKEYFPFMGYHDAESDAIVINEPFANRGKSAPCLVCVARQVKYLKVQRFFHSQLAGPTSRDAAGGGKNPCFLCLVLNYVPLTIFRLFCFQARGSTAERGLPLWKAKLLHREESERGRPPKLVSECGCKWPCSLFYFKLTSSIRHSCSLLNKCMLTSILSSVEILKPSVQVNTHTA